jgi:hypothetical protein
MSGSTNLFVRCHLATTCIRILLTILVLVSSSASSAQSLGRTEALTREQTVDLIGHVLAEVQSNFPSPAQALTLEQPVVEQMLKSATAKVMDLRDALSDNHFIQILSFSIELPSGVSVQFAFPPEDRGE